MRCPGFDFFCLEARQTLSHPRILVPNKTVEISRSLMFGCRVGLKHIYEVHIFLYPLFRTVPRKCCFCAGQGIPGLPSGKGLNRRRLALRLCLCVRACACTYAGWVHVCVPAPMCMCVCVDMGACAYLCPSPGEQTKLVMNASEKKFKRTTLDKLTNQYLVGIFVLLGLLCIISGNPLAFIFPRLTFAI